MHNIDLQERNLVPVQSVASSSRRAAPIPLLRPPAPVNPDDTRRIAVPRRVVDRRPYRDAAGLHIPPQRLVRERQPVAGVRYRWDVLMQRSIKLLETPTDTIRNPTLRKVLQLVHRCRGDVTPAVWFDQADVVYVIYYTKTSQFYVGESQHCALDRLRQHWSHRHCRGASTASQLFLREELRGMNPLDNVRIFPVLHTDGEAERKRLEMDTIAYLRQSRRFAVRCLNKVVPHGRRLRHSRLPPVGAPCATNPLHFAAPQTDGCISHLSRLPDDQVRLELAAMRPETLRRLKYALLARSPLRSMINDALQAYYRQQRPPRPRLVVTFCSPKFDRLRLHNLLRSCPWPLEHKFLSDIQIAYRGAPTAGQSFRNFVRESLAIGKCDVACHCADLAIDPKHLYEGHLLTTDTSVLPIPSAYRDAIRQVVEVDGSNFRLGIDTWRTQCLVNSELQAFYDRCLSNSRHKDDPASAVAGSEWVSSMANRISSALLRVPGDKLRTLDFHAALEAVWKDYIIAPADKNPQKSVVWCKKLYYDRVQDFLANFEPVSDPFDVLKRQQESCKKLGKPCYRSFAYPYLLAKLHKLETHRSAFRPIVGKSRSNVLDGDPELPGKHTLSAVGVTLAKALDSVIDVFVLADVNQPVKKCWVVRTNQEFIDGLSAVVDERTKALHTDDFTAMYTNIPLDALETEVLEAVDLAADMLANQLNCSAPSLYFTNAGTWITSRRKVRGAWSVAQIKEASKLFIHNSYVLTDGKMYRQHRGIGMGREPSPPFANLFCMMRERKWIEARILGIGLRGVIDIYKGFRGVFRFIDDRLSTLPPVMLPSSDDYGGLQLVPTGDGNQAVFLGIQCTLERHNDRFVTFAALDKAHGFKFTLVRFPSWSTCLPRRVAIGTMMGMLSRTLILTSRISAFVVECRFLLRQFIKRGYPEHAIKTALFRFARRRILPPDRSVVTANILSGVDFSTGELTDVAQPVLPLSAAVAPFGPRSASSSDRAVATDPSVVAVSLHASPVGSGSVAFASSATTSPSSNGSDHPPAVISNSVRGSRLPLPAAAGAVPVFVNVQPAPVVVHVVHVPAPAVNVNTSPTVVVPAPQVHLAIPQPDVRVSIEAPAPVALPAPVVQVHVEPSSSTVTTADPRRTGVHELRCLYLLIAIILRFFMRRSAGPRVVEVPVETSPTSTRPHSDSPVITLLSDRLDRLLTTVERLLITGPSSVVPRLAPDVPLDPASSGALVTVAQTLSASHRSIELALLRLGDEPSWLPRLVAAITDCRPTIPQRVTPNPYVADREWIAVLVNELRNQRAMLVEGLQNQHVRIIQNDEPTWVPRLLGGVVNHVNTSLRNLVADFLQAQRPASFDAARFDELVSGWRETVARLHDREHLLIESTSRAYAAAIAELRQSVGTMAPGLSVSSVARRPDESVYSALGRVDARQRLLEWIDENRAEFVSHTFDERRLNEVLQSGVPSTRIAESSPAAARRVSVGAAGSSLLEGTRSPTNASQPRISQPDDASRLATLQPPSRPRGDRSRSPDPTPPAPAVPAPAGRQSRSPVLGHASRSRSRSIEAHHRRPLRNPSLNSQRLLNAEHDQRVATFQAALRSHRNVEVWNHGVPTEPPVIVGLPRSFDNGLFVLRDARGALHHFKLSDGLSVVIVDRGAI
jgi:hypothetical protein